MSRPCATRRSISCSARSAGALPRIQQIRWCGSTLRRPSTILVRTTSNRSAVAEANSTPAEVPLVGLVTIWYRAAREMERFLADLAAIEYPRLLPVFVVHDQTPGEVQRLRQAAPYARVIQPRANVGTAAGWNLGIKCLLDAGVDYIGIWNVDVRP